MASSFSSPWPDPKSPILSKIDFGVPLVELLKWLEVRDTFLGDNQRKQDMTSALKLAKDCKHPDAVWLSSICWKGDETKNQSREVFLSCENDEARAFCFAWYMSHERRNDLNLLQCSAEMGFGFACATLSERVWFEKNNEDAFRLAQLAAAQHERNGFYALGHCFHVGRGCEIDPRLAKENFLIAAELGHAGASERYCHFLDESDPAHWIWLIRSASRGSSTYSFLPTFSKQVHNFFSGFGNASVVFLIGQALKGKVNMEKKQILGWHIDFDSLVGPAHRAVSFYDSQTRLACLAVDTWTLVAMRMHVIKDVRILIGKMIWEARFEANY